MLTMMTMMKAVVVGDDNDPEQMMSGWQFIE